MSSHNARRFCTGSALLLVFIVGGLLLVGCESVAQRQERARQFIGEVAGTATGAVTQAVGQVKGAMELGRGMIETVREGVEDVQRRVDAVKEGVGKIQEGKKLIEEGMEIEN